MAGQFTMSIERWVGETRAAAEKSVRDFALATLDKIVHRTPVGNPELWAANRGAMYMRRNYNLFVERANELAAIENQQLAMDPANLTRTGRLRNPIKPIRKLSRRTLNRKFKLRAGKGYVGGRARGNWQVSMNTPITEEIDAVDPSGARTVSKGKAVLSTWVAGDTIYFTNNVPYAERLEYGWSKQAPAGMVRVTLAEQQQIHDSMSGGAR